MDWQHPEALYLILPLCVVWLVLALYSDRRRQMARERFAATAMWSRIFPRESSLRFWSKLLLREIAIVSGLVALAGPRFGMEYEQVIPRGSDLYVLIDVSRSMLADDVPPSRLARAKADVSSLLNRLEGERVGLIAFAGQAVVKCPLTVDYDSFRRALNELDPDSAPRGGTAIGDAIRKAIEVFHAKSDRDQAVLLITDGDDQQSYPLEAAEVAAERHVTVFTVGLGDTERGARVPQKGGTNTFVEYEGQQVWSKLGSDLLEQIALKTNGVYVPAGTRAYDLGELYTNHLHGRRGADEASQERIRRSERYQVFLGIALIALLIDLCVAPYQNSSLVTSIHSKQEEEPSQNRSRTSHPRRQATVTMMVIVLLNRLCTIGWAVEPNTAVREGLRLYSSEKYEDAREKFAAASEELEKQKSAAAAIAAFDEACAYHRKGDLEHARDCYLRAGLSPDMSIATAAHFNLGNLSAEKARTLCGEKPESVPADKRQEILDELTQAVAAYRHCLELNHNHPQARRNLELVRQWMKYYTDKWREEDRRKRREETNLLQFLEFLTQAQTALKATTNQLPETAPADAFAELKRGQDELAEEIPTLRDKIAKELRPPEDPQAATQANSTEVDEGITLLQTWADTAGQKMAAAARQLGAHNTGKADTEQKAALDELNKIWEAVVPFHPLLARELADQTSIKKSLLPNAQQENTVSESGEKQSDKEAVEDLNSAEEKKETNPQPNNPQQSEPQQQIVEVDLNRMEELQTRAMNRARLLAPKAEAELNRLESSPAQPNAPDPNAPDDDQTNQQTADAQPKQVDPEKMKEGYRKAIELAPKAVDQMESAVKSIRQKDRQKAGEHAEEARKILEEIQQAQPKNEQQQDQQNQNDQQQNQGDQNQENQNQDQQKKDGNKDDQQDKDQQKKDEQKKSQEEQKKQQQQQASQDRIEDALRKVRERQQEKRERDKKLKGQFLGRVPVDKDW